MKPWFVELPHKEIGLNLDWAEDCKLQIVRDADTILIRLNSEELEIDREQATELAIAILRMTFKAEEYEEEDERRNWPYTRDY